MKPDEEESIADENPLFLITLMVIIVIFLSNAVKAGMLWVLPVFGIPLIVMTIYATWVFWKRLEPEEKEEEGEQ